MDRGALAADVVWKNEASGLFSVNIAYGAVRGIVELRMRIKLDGQVLGD